VWLLSVCGMYVGCVYQMCFMGVLCDCACGGVLGVA